MHSADLELTVTLEGVEDPILDGMVSHKVVGEVGDTGDTVDNALMVLIHCERICRMVFICNNEG